MTSHTNPSLAIVERAQALINAVTRDVADNGSLISCDLIRTADALQRAISTEQTEHRATRPQ